MKITSAEFFKSVKRLEDLPKDNLPEIAFAGRSNVGKSSLLNALMRKKLAYASSTPGRTRDINFFRINQKFYFVDLPGYGYAKVSKAEQEAWKELLEAYLRNRPQLRLCVMLVDARHPEMQNDKQMSEFLYFYGRPFAIALTKIDKLKKKSERENARKAVEGFFSNYEFVQEVSAQSGEGVLDLLKHIGQRVA
ncbi:MAG: ribosome biogenesis GTP-binding protein YihA/YsxC [Chloroherpetonaceae bacterium]|nr:ribosome biogenesis GTP-binding protein YihA/YsxC [Chloroherpetonaceae bacterium]MDW8436762.1 ribosome biogenesis GTP-binding protein YihA/YsxC [Chloroherpetonaceae bacterium]